MALDEALRARIQQILDGNPVVLFMKGTRAVPQCGFSAQVVAVLDEYLPEYETVNVLADGAVREGIKEFSDWPTLPQLYVEGDFVGGCDIVRDMHESGELASVLGRERMAVAPPSITVTDAAARAFGEARAEADDEHLRLEVGPRFQYALSFGPRLDGDLEVEANSLTLLLDRQSARRAGGMTIDFVDGPEGAGFKITNPNEPPKVKSISVAALKQRLDARERLYLFDTRRPDERDISRLDEAVLFDDAAMAQIASLPKSTPLYFICRTGARSGVAAERYLAEGYTDVTNVEGGMNAYADLVPGMRKY